MTDEEVLQEYRKWMGIKEEHKKQGMPLRLIAIKISNFKKIMELRGIRYE